MNRATRQLLPFLLISPVCGKLGAQEFESGIAAPDAIYENSTLAVEFTITSRGIPDGMAGARAWSLGVAHEDLEILSATVAGTIVDDLFDGGFKRTEITRSDPDHPANDGFISVILLSMTESASLPPMGTFTVARATYHAGAGACSRGARIAFTDGLEGIGLPVVNTVTLGSQSYPPGKAEKIYGGCARNDYLLHLGGPGNPLPIHLGERRSFAASVRLGQAASTAFGWTLAVSHDGGLFQITDLSIRGTAVEELLVPSGFALFEITSGRGNTGFTAQVELSRDRPQALPAPDEAIALCTYEVFPILNPALVGTRIETSLTFPASLRGSGGPISNTVFPPGNLAVQTLPLEIQVLPAARFIRGDPNGDGTVDIADALAVLFYLFAGEETACLEAADSNDDAFLDLSDGIAILGRLFLGGPEFPLPARDCGEDPTLPSLSCARSACD